MDYPVMTIDSIVAACTIILCLCRLTKINHADRAMVLFTYIVLSVSLLCIALTYWYKDAEMRELGHLSIDVCLMMLLALNRRRTPE